jgi:hypothetical protein
MVFEKSQLKAHKPFYGRNMRSVFKEHFGIVCLFAVNLLRKELKLSAILSDKEVAIIAGI